MSHPAVLVSRRFLLGILFTGALLATPLQALDFERVLASGNGGAGTIALNGLSADGTTVVGSGAGPSGGTTAYRRSGGTLTWLSPLSGTGSFTTTARAISANSAVIAGTNSRNGVSQAVRWVNGSLTPVALGLPAGWTSSNATRISADGTVIAGTVARPGSEGSITAPFRWTAATGTQVLALPVSEVPNGLSYALGELQLSADGNVIACGVAIKIADGTSPIRGCRWVGTGAPVFYDTPPGSYNPTFTGLSADGSVAAGYIYPDLNATFTVAARWTGTTYSALPFPAGQNGSNAPDISEDGNTIVWTSTNGQALRWTAAGTVSLGDFNTQAITANGAVVAGSRTKFGRSEPVIWDEFNGVRSLITIFLRNFTDPVIGRFQAYSVASLRQNGGVLTLAGGLRAMPTPYESTGRADGWVATLDAATAVEPNPFAGTLLDTTEDYSPTLKLSETFKHSLASGSSDGFPFTDAIARYSTSFAARISMAGVDLASLNADTPVQLVFGSMSYTGKLGDDPNYAPGHTGAILPTPRTGFILTWNEKELTIKLDYRQAENLAGDFTVNLLTDPGFAMPAYAGRSSSASTYFDFDFRFGDRRGSRPVALTVAAKRKTVERADERFRLADAKITGAFDEAAPKLKFVSPATGAKLYTTRVPVVLTAADNGFVQQVRVRLNGGQPVDTSPGTHNFLPAWVLQVQPVAGLNTLEAEAIDYAGNVSATARTKFTYFEKGGDYSGLLRSSGGVPRGRFTLKITDDGAFSGAAILDGKPLKLRGVLAPDGTVQFTAGKDAETITVRFALAADGVANVISGTLERSGEVLATVDAARLIYDGKTILSPLLGVYTMLLPASADPAAPPGAGYAKGTVNAAGSVKFIGKLADGSAFSLGGAIDGRDSLALFVKASGAGFLAGQLTFRDIPAQSDFDGTLRWSRPQKKSGFYAAGFAVDLAASGSHFDGVNNSSLFQPTNDQGLNARLRFSGGNLTTPVEQAVAVSYLLYPPSPKPPGFTLPFRFDGLFTGAFLDPGTGKTRKFQGALHTKSSAAAGFFIGTDRGGLVELIPGFQ